MLDYIKRHWRGELSLPRSYWIDGALIGLPFTVYFAVAETSFHFSFANYLLLIAIPYLARLPLQVWQGVGIWRSAGRRIAEDDMLWPWIARAVVLVGALSAVVGVQKSAQNFYAIWSAYLIEDHSHFAVIDHGNYAVFRGTIVDAAADKLVPLLEMSRVQRLVINSSNGGFIQPTLRIAKVIHDRKLTVVAIGYCYSSCTGLVAAGVNRAFMPDTVAGFHIGTIAGSEETASDWDAIDDYYHEDGMSQAMFDEVHAHRGGNDLYFPPISELIDNGFLNYVYDSKLKRYVAARSWCAANAVQCSRSGLENAKAEKQK